MKTQTMGYTVKPSGTIVGDIIEVFFMVISDLQHALRVLINSMYPHPEAFSETLYSADDVVNQLVFEIIKEELKKYAPRKTVTDYLGEYDVDGSGRKYTRAIQYAQHYRSFFNDEIEAAHGIRIPELEEKEMSGAKVFQGHRFAAYEFLGLKLQAECRLLNKLHMGQIASSKKVSEKQFQELFNEYEERIDGLEPPITSPEEVISNTYAYYGIETHFLTEFLYRLTLSAEAAGYPKDCPTDRIITICSINPIIPETSWCPEVYYADFCMLPRWDSFCMPVFSDSEDEWLAKECLIWDCKQMKTVILQRNLDKLIEMVHAFSIADKASFIEDHYWIWDKRPEYDWTPERIRYYRKLYTSFTRNFPKPHIK